MNPSPSSYQPYLLRLWRDNPNAKWQASLDALDATHQYNFPNLAMLVMFLEAKVGEKIILETAAALVKHHTEALFM